MSTTYEVPADDADEVALSIDGEVFRFWQEFKLTRTIDAMDTLSFRAPFDSDSPAYRSRFRPLSYQPLAVHVGGAVLFSGTLVNAVPALANDALTVGVSGYSRPGVLRDCTPPISMADRLEFDDYDLRKIAELLAEPFEVEVVFDAPPGPVFERVGIKPAERVLAFLIKLAQQRGLLVSSTSTGQLLFAAPSSQGTPVAQFEEGAAPLLSVSPFFSPQDYYSQITGIEPVLVGTTGSQVTVPNGQLPNVHRPLTFTAPDTEPGTVRKAVEAKAGRMFAQAISYRLEVATWRDQGGSLWEPGALVSLLAPGAMIYSPYVFLIRAVEFHQTDSARTATLDLILPGAFAAELPESLPWGE